MKLTPRDMALIALFAAVITLCSWISIPAAVPFTLQTFAVFSAVLLLGGRRGLWAVVLYIFLGAVGLPVFSGFRGGIGALLGPTGGYILGFIFSALTVWAVTARCGERAAAQIVGMALGLLVCYAFGTAWFMVVYARAHGPIGVGAALSMCVLPFIIPDAVKIALAYILTRRLKKLSFIRNLGE